MKILTLDVTAYEHADIVHDLQEPVPSDLLENFDFVWNGSCLDNMFDPAEAHRNSCRMVKRGGRIMTMEMGNNHFQAYSMFSQAWFFDYYALNGFDEFETYSCVFPPAQLWNGPYEAWTPQTYHAATSSFPTRLVGRRALLTLAIATRACDRPVTGVTPIQSHYRPQHESYEQAYARFSEREKLFQVGASARSRPKDGFVKVETMQGVKGGFEPNSPGSRTKRYVRHPVRTLQNLGRRVSQSVH